MFVFLICNPAIGGLVLTSLFVVMALAYTIVK